jgi:hypothetical protein
MDLASGRRGRIWPELPLRVIRNPQPPRDFFHLTLGQAHWTCLDSRVNRTLVKNAVLWQQPRTVFCFPPGVALAARALGIGARSPSWMLAVLAHAREATPLDSELTATMTATAACNGSHR